MEKKIFVTGSTGHIGSALVGALQAKGVKPVCGVTAPEKAYPGLDFAVINYSNVESMKAAFRGVDSLFMLLPLVEPMAGWAENIIEAAKASGVKFILRSSGMGADADSPYALQRTHGMIDKAVTDSGIPCAIVRPNSFMQNFAIYSAQGIRNGVVFNAQGDGKSGYVDVRDIAAVCAEVLSNPDAHIGKTYDVTGPEALSNAEACAIIGSVIGHEVRTVDVTEEAVAAGMKRMGMPEWNIEVMLSLSRFIKDKNASHVSSAVMDITGALPISFERFAEEYKEAWA